MLLRLSSVWSSHERISRARVLLPVRIHVVFRGQAYFFLFGKERDLLTLISLAVDGDGLVWFVLELGEFFFDFILLFVFDVTDYLTFFLNCQFFNRDNLALSRKYFRVNIKVLLPLAELDFV